MRPCIRTWLLAAATFIATGAHAAPFVSETPAELAATLDANADGQADFLLVEKASGVRRLGLQQADGSFLWSEPSSTSVEDVTGLGIGTFADGSAADGFAVASPTANRVMVFPDVTGDPVLAPSVGIGPNLVVGFNFAGDSRDDLAIGTEWDNPPAPVHLAGLQSGSGGLSPIYGPHEESGVLSRGNRARFRSDRPWMLSALRAVAGGREFITRPIFGFPGFADGPALGGLAADTEWAWGEFATNAFARFLFYSPGKPSLFVPGIEEPVPYQFAWTPGSTYDLGHPIARVLVLQEATGGRLLVLFDDGASAATYDFDGLTAPVQRQTMTAPAGNRFSVGGALANGDFVLLNGAEGAAGASTAWQHWGFDGTQHKVVASGALPALDVSQARANVLLFGADPELNSEAPLLRTFRVGEWSDSAAAAGGNLHVIREQYLGATLGLGAPAATDVPVSLSAFFPSVNQLTSAESVSVFAPPATSLFAELAFSPAPGTYHLRAGSSLEVRIVSAAGGTVFFRTDPAQAWTAYNNANPSRISATTTFTAYVGGASPGPLRAATYVIADAPGIVVAPPVDANHNGLPDAWEQAFGLSDPQGDPDGDGATNLQEYLAGTDPLDPSSVPPVDLSHIAVVARLPGAGAPNGTICEIAWPASVTRVVLEWTDDLGDPSSWAPAAGAAVTVGTEWVYYEPMNAGRAASYYRLRAQP